MKRFLFGLSLAILTSPALRAQDISIYLYKGFESFPKVWYIGGDATMPKRLSGMLLLNDSTIAFHACRTPLCYPDSSDLAPFKPTPLWRVRLVDIKSIWMSSRDEMISFTYENGNTVEVPKFEGWNGQAAALDAKIRFRMKKLGVVIP